jgi:hypothetical protein
VQRRGQQGIGGDERDGRQNHLRRSGKWGEPKKDKWDSTVVGDIDDDLDRLE